MDKNIVISSGSQFNDIFIKRENNLVSASKNGYCVRIELEDIVKTSFHCIAEVYSLFMMSLPLCNRSCV